MPTDNSRERIAYIASILGNRTKLTIDEYLDITGKFGCTLNIAHWDVKRLTRDDLDTCTIYGLSDPETGLIRYVGQTHGDPLFRLGRHIGSTRTGKERNLVKAKWISELLEKGQKPQLVILERCDTQEINEREQWWIKHYLAAGSGLTNSRGRVTRETIELTDQHTGDIYHIVR